MEEAAALTPSYAGVTHERLEGGERLQGPVKNLDHPGTPILHIGQIARGKGKFMPSILPSFYRVHEAGINSRVPLELQLDRRIQTFSAISAYYRRHKNAELERYFLGEIYKISIFRYLLGHKFLPFKRQLKYLARKIMEGRALFKKR